MIIYVRSDCQILHPFNILCNTISVIPGMSFGEDNYEAFFFHSYAAFKGYFKRFIKQSLISNKAQEISMNNKTYPLLCDGTL